MLEGYYTECDACGSLVLGVQVSLDCKVFLCDPCVKQFRLLPILVAEAIHD